MKKTVHLSMLTSGLILLGNSAFAASNMATDVKSNPTNNITLTCNGNTISLGQNQAQISKYCGKPSLTRNYKKSNSTVLAYKYVDPSNNKLMVTKTKLKFRNDKLQDISYESEDEKFDD